MTITMVAVLVIVIYGWDPRKASENLKRHKVSFDEATTVFTMPTKNLASNTTDELRSAYDLSSLKARVRGKHYSRATAGTTLVLLEPDVDKTFPDGSSVNEALRTYLHTSQADRDKLPERLQPVAARRSSKKRSSRRG